MNEQKITREEAIRLIDSVSEWTCFGRTYTGSVGLLNIIVSEFGRLGGMRERDGRVWNAECYLKGRSMWQETSRGEYDLKPRTAEDLFKKVEAKYRESSGQIGVEELVKQTISLLRDIK